MRGTGGMGAESELLERERVAFVERNLVAQRGRRRLPHFWPDADVRRMLIAERDFLTIDMARARALSMLGPKRAPSRSAIGRFWLMIDKLERRG